MSFQYIRSAIQSKLDDLSTIEVVYNYPTIPKKIPGATITPSEAESDYETTVENKRIYGFIIKLYYSTSVGNSAAVTALEGLVDQVVDAFDSDPQLADESLSMPAKYTMIQLVPTPSIWTFFEDYIVAEIKISAMVSFEAT